MNTILYILVCLLVCTNICVYAQNSITIGTYNIRYPNTNDYEANNSWDLRLSPICDIIKFYNFDIIGLQEVHTCQLDSISKMLVGYGSIGADSKDSKHTGVYNRIFYKQKRMKLLDKGDFWLSETPDSISKGWDAKHLRICSWGLFQDSTTNKKLLFCNVHLDNAGEKARIKSAEIILQKIAELAIGTPTVLVGDMNSNEESEVYKTLIGNKILYDTYNDSEIRYAPNGTFNGFNPTRYNSHRIDHIFISKGIKVSRYGVLTDTYWQKQETEVLDSINNVVKVKTKYMQKTPSDHYPVMAEIKFK